MTFLAGNQPVVFQVAQHAVERFRLQRQLYRVLGELQRDGLIAREKRQIRLIS